MTPPDFFPLRAGAAWDYRTRGADGAGRLRVEVLGVRRQGKSVRARCRRTSVWGERAEVTEFDAVRDATGLYFGRERQFPLPLAVGRAWRRAPMEFRVAGLSETTTVPAGTFRGCLKISYLVAGGDAGGGERFYAPGVGFVREDCRDETDPFECALERARAAT